MRIKNIVVSIGALAVLTACGMTKEEKAQEMAANYLKGVLFHYDSYEPLQTRVDSSFVSLATDVQAIQMMEDMLNLFHTSLKYVEELNDAERDMEIWAPSGFGYQSAYSKGKYRRAKEERDRIKRQVDKVKERIQGQFDKIKNRQAELAKEGEFDGWRVYHKFKSANGGRTVDLFGEYIFLCDTEFNEKIAYSKEDFDGIKKIMMVISQSDSIEEMIENLQDEFLY